jgi:hypothetical protein
MTTYQAQLTIDFGKVGYWNGKENFRVRLDASPLAQLVKDAGEAFRVYELLLITRLGDVWDYVYVEPEDVPRRVSERIASAREDAKPCYSDKHPWPEGKIPFATFDKLFFWSWDDTDPEDEAWLSHRGSSVMNSYARELLAIVSSAKARLNWNDPLLKHIIRLVETGKHDYDALRRPAAIAADESYGPSTAQHSEGFYKKLDELLRDPELVSVAYRADGDYRVLREMATEQRRRANSTGHRVGDSLYLSALVNRTISNTAWDSEIWLFSEGLAHGDLFIQGSGMDSNSIKTLIEDIGRCSPGRHILSWRDEGDISGYTKETGDGWWLYRKDDPDSRRRCLCRCRSSSRDHLPVLAFDSRENVIHSHENVVVMVGPEVGQATLDVLAEIVTDWSATGCKPLLVVSENSAATLGQLSSGAIVVPAASRSTEEDGRPYQLRRSIRDRLGWIDVVFLIDAPEWMQAAMSWFVEDSNGPWKTWVISTAGQNKLETHYSISGDIREQLQEAHRRAISLRPRLL